jgi:hypothetical protein
MAQAQLQEFVHQGRDPCFAYYQNQAVSIYQEQARARMQRPGVSTVKHMRNTVDKDTDAAEGREESQGGEKTEVPRQRMSESEATGDAAGS